MTGHNQRAKDFGHLSMKIIHYLNIVLLVIVQALNI